MTFSHLSHAGDALPLASFHNLSHWNEPMEELVLGSVCYK
jgi:hypothetical protein